MASGSAVQDPKLCPEVNKRPGVFYAFTRDGIELPVVDVTHPAFAISITDPELKTTVEKFLREGVPLAKLPKPLRELALRFLLRQSVLAQGIDQARASFMSGMQTYLLKLGPGMLGSAYSKPIDRQIASALPSFCVRLRLQDMAQLMAKTLIPLLIEASQRPVRFVNIAGGPAMDSLNALLLMNRDRPEILQQRKIEIDVFDLEAGPAFGESALAALSQSNAPLHGLRLTVRHFPYNWTRALELAGLLKETKLEHPITICSSEGGLFEYRSDEEIVSNLKALRGQRDVVAVTGSVTRADEPIQQMRKATTSKTRPRGVAVFRRLISPTGWTINRVIERPFRPCRTRVTDARRLAEPDVIDGKPRCTADRNAHGRCASR
jgi:hypothetical protein